MQRLKSHSRSATNRYTSRLKSVVTRLLGFSHTVPLSMVGLACLFGQFAILTRKPLIVQTPDSPSYIALGLRLSQHPSPANLFDVQRTPAYPAFLAVLDVLRGHEAGNAVAFAQGALMVLTAFELYALTHGVTSSRVAASLAGILIGTNLFLLDWERTIMTEVLAVFALTSTVLCFWLWTRYRSFSCAAGFSVAATLAILSRPSLLIIPVGFVVLLLIGDRRRWLPALLMTSAIYLPVLGYGIVNDRISPHAGLTEVSNINLLGKILEYRMESEGDPGRFPALYQAANSLPADDPNPYLIPQSSTALGPNFWDAAEFSWDIIRRHPLEYASKSWRDLTVDWLVVPYTFAPVGYTFEPVRSDPAWSQVWMRVSLAAYDSYLLLPFASLAFVALWRRRLNRQVALGTAALVLAVVGDLITTAVLGYTDVARLRTPVDPLAMVLVVAVTVQSLKSLAVLGNGIDQSDR